MLVCIVVVIVLTLKWWITKKQVDAAHEHTVSHQHTGKNTSLTCINNNSRLFMIQLVHVYSVTLHVFKAKARLFTSLPTEYRSYSNRTVDVKQEPDDKYSPQNILQALSFFLAESCVTVVGIPFNGFILQGCHGSIQVEETVVRKD